MWFREIDEEFSTQECGACGAYTGPKGLARLRGRDWTCSDCGVVHQRNANRAQVINARGLTWLKNEFSTTRRREPFKLL